MTIEKSPFQRFREDEEFSVRQLAEMLCISEESLLRIERGEIPAGEQTLALFKYIQDAHKPLYSMRVGDHMLSITALRNGEGRSDDHLFVESYLDAHSPLPFEDRMAGCTQELEAYKALLNFAKGRLLKAKRLNAKRESVGLEKVVDEITHVRDRFSHTLSELYMRDIDGADRVITDEVVCFDEELSDHDLDLIMGADY